MIRIKRLRTVVLGTLFTQLLAACGATPSASSVIGNSVDPKLEVLPLYAHKWRYGSENCTKTSHPAIESTEIDESTFVIRQHKCTTFEAPFMFAFSGTERTFIVDSGAIEDSNISPVAETFDQLLTGWFQTFPMSQNILLAHSHGHGDHKAGDQQFLQRGNAKVVKDDLVAIQRDLNLNNWPNESSEIDLGGRSITVIPTPGHLEDALTFYDSKTKFLITGDSFYPGLVYVKDWQAYTKSIARLVSFAEQNEVVAILGTHLEMSNTPGTIYPIGALYQPNELPLPLSVADLQLLHKHLQSTTEPREIVFEKFIIRPLSAAQKVLGNVLSVFSSN